MTHQILSEPDEISVSVSPDDDRMSPIPSSLSFDRIKSEFEARAIKHFCFEANFNSGETSRKKISEQINFLDVVRSPPFKFRTFLAIIFFSTRS